jgi:hypothetical protein
VLLLLVMTVLVGPAFLSAFLGFSALTFTGFTFSSFAAFAGFVFSILLLIFGKTRKG